MSDNEINEADARAGEEERKALGVFYLRLAGKERPVRVLNIFNSAGFRKKVWGAFSPFLGSMVDAARDSGGFGSLRAAALHDALAEVKKTELVGDEAKAFVEGRVQSAVDDAASEWVMGSIGERLLIQAPEDFCSLPFWYDPSLEEYKARSTDEELVAAALEVVKRFVPLLLSAKNGLTDLLPDGLLPDWIKKIKTMGQED